MKLRFVINSSAVEHLKKVWPGSKKLKQDGKLQGQGSADQAETLHRVFNGHYRKDTQV